MKKTIILLALILTSISSFSHPWKPAHYVLIDTDGGIDDMRAITLLLASPDVRVLGIIVSPGALNADSAYVKVKSLLYAFYHEGVPVGINRSSRFRSPDFPVAMNTSWGKKYNADLKKAPAANEMISEILSFEKSKISFISLGSLSAAASAMEEIPAFSTGIKEIIWSGDGMERKDGFNLSADRSAAETVINGKIPVRVVRTVNGSSFYDNAMIKEIAGIPGGYSGAISAFFKNQGTSGHAYSYDANDEMTSLYLQFPGYFMTDKKTGSLFCPPDTISKLKAGYVRMLSGSTVPRNQVIRNMPFDGSFYFDDLAPAVPSIIERYGLDEWSSGVLASELHRHLGTFAIIGVKMGIRAREYFNTGVDEFKAVSYAGSMPPLSCMNDGIQVSTGATPGHGLLTVINENTSPIAEFTYMNRKIRLTLKPEIAVKISEELKQINFVYGLDSNIYWELVRKNTIRYWQNLDRHEIFEIEEE